MKELSEFQAKTLYKQAMKTVTARSAKWLSSNYNPESGRLRVEATVPKGLAKVLYDQIQLTGLGNNEYNAVSVRVNAFPTLWSGEHQSYTDSHIVTLLVVFPSISMDFYNEALMTPSDLNSLLGDSEGIVTRDFNSSEELTGEVDFS